MRFFRVKVVRTLPHPGRGFTQGLTAEGQTVWESAGQYGMSLLRRYELGAAKVTAAPRWAIQAAWLAAHAIESSGSYAEFERDVIAKALERTGGNKVRAARILKISRKKLYARIDRYGLSIHNAAQKTIPLSNHSDLVWSQEMSGNR